MIHFFNFDGVESLDYGIVVKSSNFFDIAAKDIEFLPVPGRNGDLVIDNKRYKNIDITFEVRAKIPSMFDVYDDEEMNFDEYMRAVRKWLNQDGNYKKVEDSFSCDYFRLGVFMGDSKIERICKNVYDITLTFNCKPHRYRYTGEQKKQIILLPKDGNIHYLENPDDQEALPIIEAYCSSGTTMSISINGVSYSLSNMDSSAGADPVIIDSEMQHCYKGQTSYDNYFTSSDGNFPILRPGTNVILSTSGHSSYIKPNWRAI